ncbi:DUF4194 domain-containing protein [Proteiniclasticum sp. QWL-01]|uniref:DUF4194 domain-containing protein n=1 Tax=Proteiniclasticum sp. QWL-01 TaxID=3036945 RepID=UPI0021FA9C4A|nr:DUF4194 domain-containing protein [Proteiniclasticum sp. QWL-01]UUM12691.1 DUF4194 domain-containing protein [Clostridiaceae bacterium HFYG-1003]WFF74242.1 DUF4194 domain-containing protein [Proteiniclasticum sp. QWL-01]
MKWNERYDNLNSTDKAEFRRLVNYLFSHTYLVRDVYRPDKQWLEPGNDYRLVSRHFELFQEYFAVAGWRLDKDDTYGIVSLTSEFDQNRLRLDRFTTLFLYTCRLMFEEGRELGDQLNHVRTDTGTVVEKMRSLGLLSKGRSTQKERMEAQRTLSHFNIIQKLEATAWSAEGNSILILPSILVILPNHEINNIVRELEELRQEVQTGTEAAMDPAQGEEE